MIFVESPWFCGWRETYLGDDDFKTLQSALLENPETGDLIAGSHGLRKLRVALPGRGKRGGGRLIYYYWVSEERIYLLFGYAKNAQSDLTKDQIRRLAAAMREDLNNG